MAPAVRLTTEPSLHRIHVSGLHSSTKPKDLMDRFSSFGTVVGGEEGVAGLGVDANGTPRKYAFLTLETTDQQIAKCTSMLSGSMWKGHKLRIAPARPAYHTRMADEREAINAGKGPVNPSKKRKHNPDPLVGTLASHFELVTEANLERHRGWTLDPLPIPAPIFPLVTRPSHPLPLQPKAAPTSWTREAPKARAAKKARAAARLGLAAPVKPALTRARRIRIDPRKWGRKKVIFEDHKEGGATWEVRGGWECVEGEDGKAEEVAWVFKGKDGVVRRQEVVRLTQRSVPHTDSFKAILDALSAPVPAEALSPLTPVIAAASSSALLLDSAPEAPATARPRSLSPPVYIPSAPRTLLYNEEDTFALLSATQDDDEALDARRREKDAQLKVLRGLLGAGEDVEVPEQSVTDDKLPPVEGFGDEDEDDEVFEVLRLRGGGGDSEEEDASDEEDDDEDAEMADVAKTVVSATEKAKTTLQMGSLKDMFKPQEAAATSFSLLSGLDLELEPLERTPSPPPTTYRVAPAPTAAFVPPAALGRQGRAWIGTGPLTPFFAFPSGKFEGRDGAIVETAVVALGVEPQRTEQAKVESSKRLGEGARTFWKSETLEEIEAQHQALREALRGQARKRHREASKRGRKKGTGKRQAEIGGGGAAAEEDVEL